MKIIARLLLVVFVMAFAVNNSYATEKPNVFIMMVDNLGWGEIGTYGGVLVYSEDGFVLVKEKEIDD